MCQANMCKAVSLASALTPYAAIAIAISSRSGTITATESTKTYRNVIFNFYIRTAKKEFESNLFLYIIKVIIYKSTK